MKHFSLNFTILLVLLFGLYACEGYGPGGPPKNDYTYDEPFVRYNYISTDSAGEVLPVYLYKSLYGEFNDGYDIDLNIYAGLSCTVLDSIISHEAVLPTDVIHLYLDLGSSEEEYLPTGRYTLVYDSVNAVERSPLVIANAYLFYYPKGTDFSEPIDETANYYRVISADMDVRHGTDSCFFFLSGRLHDNTRVKLYFDGRVLPYPELPGYVPNYIKQQKR